MAPVDDPLKSLQETIEAEAACRRQIDPLTKLEEERLQLEEQQRRFEKWCGTETKFEKDIRESLKFFPDPKLTDPHPLMPEKVLTSFLLRRVRHPRPKSAVPGLDAEVKKSPTFPARPDDGATKLKGTQCARSAVAKKRAGRPTIRSEIFRIQEERAKSGKTASSCAAEARAINSELKAMAGRAPQHGVASIPKPLSIENMIRARYRELKRVRNPIE